jgi:hypothetical protein
MLESTRQRIGRLWISREVKQEDRILKMTNLQEARHIGIAYRLHEMDDYNRILEFVTGLQHDHKEVKALGYVTEKNLTERFLPKLSYDFFSKTDVNWYYKPTTKRVVDFINQPFDLLIDLTLESCLPLFWTVALSKAHCKVGCFDPSSVSYHDLMIKPKPPVALKELIHQIKHYLTIIQTNKA